MACSRVSDGRTEQRGPFFQRATFTRSTHAPPPPHTALRHWAAPSGRTAAAASPSVQPPGRWQAAWTACARGTFVSAEDQATAASPPTSVSRVRRGYNAQFLVVLQRLERLLQPQVLHLRGGDTPRECKRESRPQFRASQLTPGASAHLQGQVLVLRHVHVRRRGSRERGRRCSRAPGRHRAGGPPRRRSSRARPVAAGVEQRAAAAVAPRHSALVGGWRAHRGPGQQWQWQCRPPAGCPCAAHGSALYAFANVHSVMRTGERLLVAIASVAESTPSARTPPTLGEAMQLRLVS